MSTFSEETHPDSPLVNLRQRREEIGAKQFTDIKVPRWENPELFVRYKPVDHSFIRKALGKMRKAKGDRGDAEVDGNADVMIQGCLGVYAMIDGEAHTLDAPDHWVPVDIGSEEDDIETLDYSEWGKFDKVLGETLGLDPKHSSARQVVRTLYITDGDVITTAQDVIRFSGYKNPDADDEFLGE